RVARGRSARGVGAAGGGRPTGRGALATCAQGARATRAQGARATRAQGARATRAQGARATGAKGALAATGGGAHGGPTLGGDRGRVRRSGARPRVRGRRGGGGPRVGRRGLLLLGEPPGDPGADGREQTEGDEGAPL